MKKRTGITIDEDVYDYLKERNINISGLANSLLKSYVGGKSQSSLDILNDRISETENEIDSLQTKLKTKKAKVQRLKKEKKSIKEKQGREDEIIGKYVGMVLQGENIRRYYRHISDLLNLTVVEIRNKVRTELKNRGENPQKYEGQI